MVQLRVPYMFGNLMDIVTSVLNSQKVYFSQSLDTVEYEYIINQFPLFIYIVGISVAQHSLFSFVPNHNYVRMLPESILVRYVLFQNIYFLAQ